MRRSYERILKQVFCNHLKNTVATLYLTQEKMAQWLAMDERSFHSLVHGQYSCSSVTLALYLLYCCPEPLSFLDELYRAFPEDLLHKRSCIPQLRDDISYRQALSVRKVCCISTKQNRVLCPRCGIILTRMDQPYCEHCGQKLCWEDNDKVI